MKESINVANLTAMENINGMREVNIKDNLKMGSDMDKESLSKQMAMFM